MIDGIQPHIHEMESQLMSFDEDRPRMPDDEDLVVAMDRYHKYATPSRLALSHIR